MSSGNGKIENVGSWKLFNFCPILLLVNLVIPGGVPKTSKYWYKPDTTLLQLCIRYLYAHTLVCSILRFVE